MKGLVSLCVCVGGGDACIHLYMYMYSVCVEAVYAHAHVCVLYTVCTCTVYVCTCTCDTPLVATYTPNLRDVVVPFGAFLSTNLSTNKEQHNMKIQNHIRSDLIHDAYMHSWVKYTCTQFMQPFIVHLLTFSSSDLYTTSESW